MPYTVPYRTMDDAVAGLTACEARFRERQDRRCIFLTLYGTVSMEIRDRLHGGFFDDNEWVHRYAVAFANLYREALAHAEAGRTSEVPKAWRLAFDAARRSRGLVLQDLLLGVNAHVNNDLPFALTRVSIDPDRARRSTDHASVNAVLAEVMDRATARVAALYAPGLATMGEGAGQLDEMLGLFSLRIARESAWESAVSLANARTGVERRLTGALIASRAAVVARLLLAPSLHPTVVGACRRLEQGPEWLTVAAAIASSARTLRAGHPASGERT